MTDIVTDLGSTSYLLIYTGSAPATCGTAASGTLLASLPCSNPFAGAPASGVLTASAITSAAAVANGTAGYWRLCTSSAGTTVIAQGLVYATSTLVTSALTAAGNNVLTFASGGGAIVVGQTVSGTNIPAGTYVLASTATSITMSANVATGGVANGATITFGGDVSFPSVAFTIGETISVSSFTVTATGA
jgi:hypothetical protein